MGREEKNMFNEMMPMSLGGESNVDINFYKQTGSQAYADSGYTYSVTAGKKYIISFFRHWLVPK